MARIAPLELTEGTPKVQETLAGVKKNLGTVPNIFKTFAHSEAVLDAYFGFSGAMAKTTISPTLRETLALAVAGKNECDYCASAHTVLGKKAGLAETEVPMNLEGKATDAKVQAAVDFALKVVETKANVKDGDVQKLRDAGYTEAEIVEIVAVVCLNIFTNYFNHIAGTEIDFPVVKTKKALV